jgi:hypothetical protein
VDADGAPNAYHPDGKGLDYLANAGYPNSSWWKDVLVEDPANPGTAYQQPYGPFKGYFVSKTSLQDLSKRDTDPARYVDATKIPYLVFPRSFYKMKGTGRLGDVGYAFNLSGGESSPFVVADIGPSSAKLGEISIALAEVIGGVDVSPKDGSGLPPGKILYVVFPYSSRITPWPLTKEQIKKTSEALLEAVGGEDAVRECGNKLQQLVSQGCQTLRCAPSLAPVSRGVMRQRKGALMSDNFPKTRPTLPKEIEDIYTAH